MELVNDLLDAAKVDKGTSTSKLLERAAEAIERLEERVAIMSAEPDMQCRCKDCKYFEIKDFWGEFNGIPVLGTSDQPTCMKWGNGDCKTSPDGFCFLAERR